MALDGISGFAPFPLYVFDASARAGEKRKQPASQQDGATQETQPLQQAEEERRTRREDLDRLDVSRLIEERIVDLADRRRAARGSIVDILV